MKGTRLHKLYFYQKVQQIAIQEYLGSWKEVWAKHVYPVYPMSYKAFLRILKEKDLRRRIEEELVQLNHKERKNEDK